MNDDANYFLKVLLVLKQGYFTYHFQCYSLSVDISAKYICEAYHNICTYSGLWRISWQPYYLPKGKG